MVFQEEREYKIKDYICLLIGHAKCMLLLIVVFAALLGGLKYVKDSRSIQESKDGIDLFISASEQVEALPESQKESIKNIASLKQSLIVRSGYRDSSLAMNLDMYNVGQKQLAYKITAKEEDLAGLKQAYSLRILSEKYKEELKAICETEYDKDIDSLIEIRYDAPHSNNIISQGDNSFLIMVKGSDKEKIMKMADVIKKAVEDSNADLLKSFGKHEIQLISESYSICKDDTLIYTRNSLDTTIFDLSNRINILENSLDATTKELTEAYINELIANEDVEDTEETKQDEAVVVKASVDKKWIVLGACAGIFLYAVCIGLIWLLNGKIKSVNEFKNNFDVNILGALHNDKKRGPLKKLAYNIQHWGQKSISNESSVELILSQILMECKKKSMKEVIISGSCFDNQSINGKITEICNELKEKGISVKTFEHFPQNADALYAAAENGNIIFVEEVEKSYFLELKEEFRKCNEYDIQVLGCMIVEP